MLTHDQITVIATFMQGAIMICAFMAALFFLRFWKVSKDRLFGWFAASFLLLGIVRIFLTFMAEEQKTGLYWLRFLAFVIILIAIADKNRPQKESK